MNYKTGRASGTFSALGDCSGLFHFKKQLRSVYMSRFKDLVFGDFPADNDLISTLTRIAARLYKIKWQMM